MTDKDKEPKKIISEDEFIPEDFDEILEWTPEEEAEFIRIFEQEDRGLPEDQ
jgi:hypothetical protein